MTKYLTLLLASVVIFTSVLSCGPATPSQDNTVQPPPPRDITAQLRLREFKCFDTTEAGADEVYILVYSTGSAAPMVRRLPGPAVGQASGHWDMNDGNQPCDNPSGDSRCITNKVLFEKTLRAGESWDVAVLFCEEDGGNSQDLQTLAGTLASRVPNPVVAGVGAVVAALGQLGFNITDTDDYLGSYAVHIENRNGTLTTDWHQGDRLFHFRIDPNRHEAMELKMNGDGSHYEAWFDVVTR
jgi:hypothetical protein